nr:hypothetical protein [Tanacetum cinerariifolium]
MNSSEGVGKNNPSRVIWSLQTQSFIGTTLRTWQKKQKSRRKQKKETKVFQDEPPTEEHIPTPSHDPLPSGEDRLQLNKLMEICTKFSDIVLSLELTKSNQAVKIEKLKKRVKKLEGKKKKRTHGLKRMYKGRMNEKDLFRVNDLDGDEVIVDVTTGENVEQDATITEKEVSTRGEHRSKTGPDRPRPDRTETELVQNSGPWTGPKWYGPVRVGPIWVGLRSGPVLHDIIFGFLVRSDRTERTEDRIGPKPRTDDWTEIRSVLSGRSGSVRFSGPMKAKMEEEERIAREKDEANIAVIEEWDDVQATTDVDKQRKYFAAKRAKEIRNKPPTKAQQKSLMCTYMKNIEGYKQKDFNGKSFDAIKKMFDKVYNRVDTFVDMNTEIVEEKLKKTQAEVTEGSFKRAGNKIEKEGAKRQRLEKEDDTAELKKRLEIVPEDDDDVTIKETPLSSKSSIIVDYKIYIEGKKSYFRIIRADENSQNYLTFGKMFKNFNREDLEVLWSIVKEIFKKTKPVDDMDNLLFQTLRTMFEHQIEDNI